MVSTETLTKDWGITQKEIESKLEQRIEEGDFYITKFCKTDEEKKESAIREIARGRISFLMLKINLAIILIPAIIAIATSWIFSFLGILTFILGIIAFFIFLEIVGSLAMKKYPWKYEENLYWNEIGRFYDEPVNI